jgi:hypothetical protein
VNGRRGETRSGTGTDLDIVLADRKRIFGDVRRGSDDILNESRCFPIPLITDGVNNEAGEAVVSAGSRLDPQRTRKSMAPEGGNRIAARGEVEVYLSTDG